MLKKVLVCWIEDGIDMCIVGWCSRFEMWYFFWCDIVIVMVYIVNVFVDLDYYLIIYMCCYLGWVWKV